MENNKSGDICHHGIKGQKWGVRRFQNEDGTLTEEGKRHYLDKSDRQFKKFEKAEKIADTALKINRAAFKAAVGSGALTLAATALEATVAGPIGMAVMSASIAATNISALAGIGARVAGGVYMQKSIKNAQKT